MRVFLTGYAHPLGSGVEKKYGAERIIWYLAQELVAQGHDVTVASVKGSLVPGCHFIEMAPAWRDDFDSYQQAVIKAEKQNGKSFDIINSFQASGNININYWITRPYYLEPFFQAPAIVNKDHPERIIANSQRMKFLNGGKSHLINYGVPETEAPIKKPDDYLVWCGRMDSGKAPHLAIETAKRAGKRIILLGHSYHYPYFLDNVYPHIDGDKVVWLRGVDDDIKIRVLRKAYGFLFPNANHYHEAFGIVAIEALRAGCPIIGWGHRVEQSAMNWNGTGEIIVDGKHGFLNIYNGWEKADEEQSVVQAVDFVKRLGEIDREECYKLYKERFTAKIMTDNHLNLWKK